MLTVQQKKLLEFIETFQKENGVSPSYQEMCEKMCIASKSGIARLVNGLEERGFIRKLRNKSRAIEIVRYADNEGPMDLVIDRAEFRRLKDIERKYLKLKSELKTVA